MKKILWVLAIVVMAGGAYWIISGLDTELQQYEVRPDGELLLTASDGSALENALGYNQSDAFFVEYRLQRDRVRSQEFEMLEKIVNNSESSPEAKQEAERMILDQIQLMEHELIVENMVRAKGYEDAVFFFRNRVATLMVKKDEISEQEFVQLTEIVAGVIGIERQDVQVITRP